MWGAVWSALDLIIPTAFGFGVFVLTSRLLSPSEFGIVALATGVTVIALALCPAGFGAALVQRREIETRHMDAVFWLCLFSGMVMYLIVALLARPIAVFFKMDLLRTLIPVLATRIIAEMAGVVPNALLARGMSFHVFAARTFVVSLLAAAVTVTLLLLHFGIWALVASQLTVTFAATAAGFWSVKWRPKWHPSLREIRELARYGAYSSASRGMGLIVAQNELLFVGYALGTAQVGYYNFARRVYSILNEVIGGALATVAHPMLSGIQDDIVRVRRGFLSATFVSSLVAFPLFVGLAIISDHIIPLLFGQRWVEATGLLKLQCAFGMISCIGALQGALVASRGRAAWWFYWQLFSTSTTMVLIILVAPYGSEAMLGSVVIKAYLVWAIPVRETLRVLSMRAIDYLLHFKGPVIGIVVMAISIYLARSWAPDLGNLAATVLEIAVGAATYVATVLFIEHERILLLVGVMFPKFAASFRSPRPAD